MLMLKCSKRAGCPHVHGDPGRGCTSQIVLKTFNVRTRHVAIQADRGTQFMLETFNVPTRRSEHVETSVSQRGRTSRHGGPSHPALPVRNDFCLKVVI